MTKLHAVLAVLAAASLSGCCCPLDAISLCANVAGGARQVNVAQQELPEAPLAEIAPAFVAR